MQEQRLTEFFNAIKEDNRITTGHISLYMALFESWNRNDFKNPVFITRKQVMETAKISGIATFHKCIKDLDELGYISYLPSRNPAVNSRVYLLKV
jgi:hypothetical protein